MLQEVLNSSFNRKSKIVLNVCTQGTYFSKNRFSEGKNKEPEHIQMNNFSLIKSMSYTPIQQGTVLEEKFWDPKRCTYNGYEIIIHI